MNNFFWIATHPFLSFKIIEFVHNVRGYAHKKINFKAILAWLNQFPETEKLEILDLLFHIHYYSEKEVKEILCKHNEKVLNKLHQDGVTDDHIIYITIGDPGSSTHIMLNLLRDGANLERRKVHLIDSKDIIKLAKLTNELGNGAVIYIDDFAGTGNQFISSREYITKNVPLLNQFSEFFLVPCICEEAFKIISKASVEVVSNYIHAKNDRLLHPDSILLNKDIKLRIVELSSEIDTGAPLGYKGLASMVVFFRNAPNGLPPLFRGNVGQDKKTGIFPRSTDLVR